MQQGIKLWYFTAIGYSGGQRDKVIKKNGQGQCDVMMSDRCDSTPVTPKPADSWRPEEMDKPLPFALSPGLLPRCCWPSHGLAQAWPWVCSARSRGGCAGAGAAKQPCPEALGRILNGLMEQAINWAGRCVNGWVGRDCSKGWASWQPWLPRVLPRLLVCRLVGSRALWGKASALCSALLLQERLWA